MGVVLVTGGSGTLGRLTVERLVAAGRPTRVLVHSAVAPLPPEAEGVHGDLATGEGLAEAVADVDVVVHAASSSSDPWGIDVEGTRRLVAALAGTATAHLVYVSIVGVERSALPYYRAKHATERLVRASGVGWSILRATQFHGFALSILRSLSDDAGTLTVPADVRLQPVEAGEVAERLVATALGGPTHDVLLFGGPQVLTLEAMAESYREASGAVRAVEVGHVDGPLLEAWRTGHQLAPAHAEGRTTWQQYVEHLEVRRAANAGRRPVASPGRERRRESSPSG